ncbi:ATP-binding protein [Streptomyces sp. NPDC026206]|uniref:ATP-binding protein n=1 Tax=Streptomyces sp. NPDC026206 TaxID=3157089 RepID=UPI0033DEDC2F
MLLPLPSPQPQPHPAPDIEPFEYRLHVPHNPRAVRVARATLRAALIAHGLGELAGRAELLAAEMLTNAITHTTGDAELRLCWSQWGVLRMTVWDTSPRPPDTRAVHAYDPSSESGRGLRLLQMLADRWDSYILRRDLFDGASKAVWCEITRRVPAAWA